MGSIQILEGLPHLRLQRIRGMIRVRDAVRTCLRAQVETTNETVSGERTVPTQSGVYDRSCREVRSDFRSASRRYVGIPRGGADLPLLCPWSTTTRKSNKPPRQLFFVSERSNEGGGEVEFKTPQDALLATLGERGHVDLDHLAGRPHRLPQDFLPELKGIIYLNPQTDRWETEDDYLSGNVRAKLATAEGAALVDERFQANVEALKQVQPADLPGLRDRRAVRKHLRIPADDIRRFAEELLGEEGISVSHVTQLGLWSVRGGYGAKFSVANTTEWGTDRRSALDLLEDALNLRTPTVYDHDDRSDRDVVNGPATEAARDKQDKIKERFKSWLWQEDERRERLARKYNDEFNNVRLRTFNGDHLTLPGASPPSPCTPTSGQPCGAFSRPPIACSPTLSAVEKPTPWSRRRWN